MNLNENTTTINQATTLVKLNNNNNNKDISTSHFNLIPKQISNLFPHNDKWYQCKIIKTKEKGSTYLRLYSDDKESKYNNTLLYTAIKKQNGNNYEIENIEHNETVSVIKWNMFSNEFIVSDCIDNDILLMNYSFRIKGLTGPSKMKIVLPKKEEGTVKDWFDNTKEKMYDKHKVFVIENKQPEYNNKYGCYVLKFKGRNVRKSVKNCQFVFAKGFDNDINGKDMDEVLLQFAEVSDNCYVLDFKYPFSELTAFAVGVISSASKILCE